MDVVSLGLDTNMKSSFPKPAKSHFCILLSGLIANGYLYMCAKYFCHQTFRNISFEFLKSSFATQMLRNSKLQSLIPNICQNGFGWFCKRALMPTFVPFWLAVAMPSEQLVV